MTEIPITTRIPKELEKELQRYMKAEHLERSGAIRKLMFESLKEWRVMYALGLLENGKVTLLKAAEIAGIDIWEITAKIKEKKIRWVSDEAIEQDLVEFR